MSVSNRFRDIAREVREFREQLQLPGEEAKVALKSVGKAGEELAGWIDAAGEIPRMKLEFKLTPVLLKAYNHLDRARLDFAAAGLDEPSAAVWELQQKIYRLLNDL